MINDPKLDLSQRINNLRSKYNTLYSQNYAYWEFLKEQYDGHNRDKAITFDDITIE